MDPMGKGQDLVEISSRPHPTKYTPKGSVLDAGNGPPAISGKSGGWWNIILFGQNIPPGVLGMWDGFLSEIEDNMWRITCNVVYG